MKNKAIVYIIAILAIFIVFMGGYYSAFYFNGIENGMEEPTRITEEEEQPLFDLEEGLEPIRDTSFIIHGIIREVLVFSEEGENEIFLSVDVDMVENFQFSPYRIVTRNFRIREESIIKTAQKAEGETPLAPIEDSAVEVDNVDILDEGDLIVIETNRSVDFLIDMDDFIDVVEVWKIVE